MLILLGRGFLAGFLLLLLGSNFGAEGVEIITPERAEFISLQIPSGGHGPCGFKCPDLNGPVTTSDLEKNPIILIERVNN